MSWPDEETLRALLALSRLPAYVREDVEEYLSDPRLHHQEYQRETEEGGERPAHKLCERLHEIVQGRWSELPASGAV